MSIIKQCLVCGKEFTATRRDAKYCGRACQSKAARERAKAGIDTTIRICSKCGKEFRIIDSGCAEWDRIYQIYCPKPKKISMKNFEVE